MLITQRVLDIVVSTKDTSHSVTVAAFHEAHSLVVSAKESEIRSLKAHIDDLNGQLKYERSRADALVDCLLQKEAHVAAVAPLAAHVAKAQDDEVVKRLKVVFDEMNAMDAPIAVPKGQERAFDMAGGTAVES